MPSGERWNIEITDEYWRWFVGLEEKQQDAVRIDIEILDQYLGKSERRG